MIFTETILKGTYLIDLQRKEDGRGFFARGFCQQEFAAHGLRPEIAQVNIALSRAKGTVRGMHYQVAPAAETKVVRCTRGALLDVILDLRPDSPTHRQWIGVELTADHHRMVYIPEGCAHGYQTLVDDTELYYQTSAFHSSGLVRGVRYDDPAFSLRWPLPVTRISAADRAWPDYRAERPVRPAPAGTVGSSP